LKFDIRLNTIYVPGSCSISPKEDGVVLSNTYIFICSSWGSDSLPLNFSFDICETDGSRTSLQTSRINRFDLIKMNAWEK
jgi:hypothetical protein